MAGKVNPEEKEKVKKGLSDYATNLREKVKIDTTAGKTVRNEAETFALDVRSLTMGFLPESTQKHITNVQKEALLTLRSLIDFGVEFLDKSNR